MEWISVNDELPQMGQKVLCIQDPNKTATREPLFALYTGQEFVPEPSTVFADYQTGKSKWVHIIYWMPLPEPPKSEQGNSKTNAQQTQPAKCYILLDKGLPINVFSSLKKVVLVAKSNTDFHWASFDVQ